MNRIQESFPGVASTFMMVAEGNIFEQPTAVQTVLGSCVSVTFFSPRQRIGAMFHALMPQRAAFEKFQAGDSLFRYVDSAINELCRRLFSLGIRQQDLECKIFGGANAMFQHELSVGPKNVRVAFETLAAFPLRVTATNVGGQAGRKIIFISHTGEVFLKHLKKGEHNKNTP